LSFWNIGAVAFYFSVAAAIYLNAQLVSPRIAEQGEIDLVLRQASIGAGGISRQAH